MRLKPIFFLADDDLDDQDLFIDALGEIDKEIRCIVASDGLEAIGKLQQPDTPVPDFIFLDQNMPIMTGVQCLRELRKIDTLAATHVVMYSTSEHLGNEHEDAKQLGAADFFQKTTSFRELVQFLRELLANYDPVLLR